jgi:hypothetical protein
MTARLITATAADPTPTSPTGVTKSPETAASTVAATIQMAAMNGNSLTR